MAPPCEGGELTARFARLIVGLILAILCTGCGHTSRPSDRPAANSAPEVKPSPPAETITVKVVSVTEYEAALARHHGKVVLVDFWATWCGPCRERFPHTLELARRLKDQGLVVISVSIDQLKEKETVNELQARVLTFLQEQDATIENLMVPMTELAAGDPAADQLIAERLDLPGGSIPHFKVFDRDGKLHRKFYFDQETLTDYLPSEIDIEIEKLLKK